MQLKCNGVFEGGGVRGIGHVGAACAIEKAGYRFMNLAGSSAGAIVASLLAVGYSGNEIRKEMETIDYLKFKQKDKLDTLGNTGKLLSICIHFGIYKTDYFEHWLTGLLAKKDKLTFRDVRINTPYGTAYKLKVTVSDLTDEKLLVLPDDLKELGIDPDTFSIAAAVRMSMSIPIFYEPFRLTDSNGKVHLIVDGGLLSNYPIWILDDGKSVPPYPTFGFQFIEENCEPTTCHKKLVKMNIVEYVKQIVSTVLDSYDKQVIAHSKGDFKRTVFIPTTIHINGETKKISSTDFAITKQESAALFQNGVTASKKFLSSWDFIKWKNEYRG